jgi:hypothetical protein
MQAARGISLPQCTQFTCAGLLNLALDNRIARLLMAESLQLYRLDYGGAAGQEHTGMTLVCEEKSLPGEISVGGERKALKKFVTIR